MLFRAVGLLALLPCLVVALMPEGRVFSSSQRRPSTELFAIGVLARKAKEASVRKLKEDILKSEESPVALLLKEAAEGSLAREAGSEVYDKLTKTKALQVMCEYHRKTLSTLRANNVAEYEIPPLSMVSSECRAAGAAVLSLNMDPMTGGCSENDFAAAVKEQSLAKNDFPGSLPVLWSDVIVDEVQLAMAAVNKAKCVTLHADALVGDSLAILLEKAQKVYGLEALVILPKNNDDTDDVYLEKLSALVTAGAKMILMNGFGFPEVDLARKAVAKLAELSKSDEKIALVARVDAEDNNGLAEAELAWKLRDVGLDAVYISDVLFKFGHFSGRLFASSPDSITSVIKAMRSKASSNFARASGAFSGKGEGAKEYLGDLLM